jgi:hypothetical protein
VEPGDADLEAVLSAQPRQRWEELEAAFAAVEALGSDGLGDWTGGDARTMVVDGVPRQVFSMPWVDYPPEVLELLRAAAGVGAVHPFDWMAWEGFERYRSGSGLDRAPAADCVRVVTTIVRGDRFSEGTLLGALRDGTLLTALRRLLRWHGELPGGSASGPGGGSDRS